MRKLWERVLAWYALENEPASEIHILSSYPLSRFAFSRESDLCSMIGVLLISAYPLRSTFTWAIVTSLAGSHGRSCKPETLIDIFERIEKVFQRLEIYTRISPPPEMIDIIVKIMVEVLSILGIATKEMKQSRTSKKFLYNWVAVD